jgi:hypothetical protein
MTGYAEIRKGRMALGWYLGGKALRWLRYRLVV